MLHLLNNCGAYVIFGPLCCKSVHRTCLPCRNDQTKLNHDTPDMMLIGNNHRPQFQPDNQPHPFHIDTHPTNIESNWQKTHLTEDSPMIHRSQGLRTNDEIIHAQWLTDHCHQAKLLRLYTRIPQK